MTVFLMSLFVMGTWTFWVTTLIAFGLLTYFVEEEYGPSSFACFVIYATLIWACNGAHNVFDTLQQSFGIVCLYALLYFVVGVVWATCKYYFKNLSISIIMKRTKATKKFHYEEHERLSKNDQWKSYIASDLSREQRKFLELGVDKGSIVIWMVYWPVSAFWTILNDPIKNGFNYLYDSLLVGLFKGIRARTVDQAMKMDDDS